MEFRIEGNPDYGHLIVGLGPGERMVAEGGAMAWMSDGVQMKARLLGGFLRAFARKLVGGESLFVGEYSHPTGGEVAFSPATPGNISHYALFGNSLILTGGAFMACTPGVRLKTRFGGFKAMFSGEGMFLIECSGQGDLFFNTYGALVEREVADGFTVDTGHVVAWEPTVDYSMRGMGGLKSTLLSGEGLAMRFSGQGKVFLQTRTLGSVANWLTPFLQA
ncbi:MAG: TIGR00266 family protein [Caldilineaceae bacterium]|nr:TIGR00266 family protein [Caldilineaceae bacterium]